jgi:hypothetical protein
MTIQEIQAALDAKYDTRQIVNMIADYIEANPGGGGGTTIYTGDGSLSGDRQVNLDGHELAFINGSWELAISPDEGYLLLANDGVQDLLLIDPVNHSSLIRTNNTPDASIAGLTVGADSGGDGVYWNISGTASSITTNIFGDAVAKTIAYAADTHTFNVGITMTEFATGGVTGASIDNDGKLIRTP